MEMPEELHQRVYVALGSNLGDREQHIVSASQEISQLPACVDFRCSALYQTDPMGPQNQPDYLNAVCEFGYTGVAHELLKQLKAIEKLHGRVKTTTRWTARPLDLDILLFGDRKINDPDLQIPHVGIAERSFVIWPLLELQPDLQIPGLGALSDLQEHCQKFGIKPYKGAAN